MAENPQFEEAIRLKTLAESKFNSSKLKSALNYANQAHNLCPNLTGLTEMITAFKILHSSRNPRKTPNNLDHPFPFPDFYDILGVTPFSTLSLIKSQYKKLALLLHPDKNTLKNASNEAFKVVNDAFHVFSDKGKRRVYDTCLRLALLEEKEVIEDECVVVDAKAVSDSGDDDEESDDDDDDDDEEEEEEEEEGGEEEEEEEKVVSEDEGEEGDDVGVRKSASLGAKKAVLEREEVESEGKELSEDEGGEGEGEGGKKAVLERGEVEDWEMSSLRDLVRKGKMKKVNNVGSKRKIRSVSEVLETPVVEERRRSNREKSRIDYRNMSRVMEEEVEKPKRDDRKQRKSVRGDDDEVEELTLAEMQMKALRKPKGKKEDGKRRVTIREEVEEDEDEDEEVDVVLNKKKRVFAESRELEVMTVEDSEFHDFDKDRVERRFKKGQVWAIYDDDDGMPRHYGLIDEVVSVKPFEVKMSWLDFKYEGDEMLICWEKRGFHVSCGKFKVARKDTVKLLNMFSHLVECERAAREMYLIYPRKGSIWALYNEKASGSEGRNYDIVLFLTSYSEVYGLSMAYLEKVDGYTAVFTRREIGFNAVRWLENFDFRLFSHQIPARKLSREEAPQVSGDCWELDPASLPQDLLVVP